VRQAWLIAAFLVAATPAAAQRMLAIENFSASIVVNTDGSLDVTETITARFNGKWNGIYRTVPVDYRTSAGLQLVLATERHLGERS
jgi:hypothetical protein